MSILIYLIVKWKEIYLNDKKLNEEEAEEYQFYIEENAWY